MTRRRTTDVLIASVRMHEKYRAYHASDDATFYATRGTILIAVHSHVDITLL